MKKILILVRCRRTKDNHMAGSIDGDDEDEDDDGADRGRWIHTGATWSSNISFRVL